MPGTWATRTELAQNSTNVTAELRGEFAAADAVVTTAFGNADAVVTAAFQAADNNLDTTLTDSFVAADWVVRNEFAAADAVVTTAFEAGDNTVRAEFAAGLSANAIAQAQTNADVATNISAIEDQIDTLR